MVKRTFCILFVFLALLLYLHQKVVIYVRAYNLNETYKEYNKLVDSRDILLYNFSKRISLAKIDSWVEANGFKLPEKDKILALNINNRENTSKNNKLASSFASIFRLSFTSRALAQERR